MGKTSEARPEFEPTPATQPDAATPPDWLTSLRGEEGAVSTAPTPTADDIPDWLKSLRADESPMPTPAPRMEAAPPAAESVPDWLTNLRGAESEPAITEPVVEVEPDAAATMPDWLASLGNEERQPATVAPTSEAAPATAAEIPDWLMSLRGEESAPTAAEPTVETEAITTEETPDWLTSLRGAESAPTAAAPMPETTAEEIPDWLKPLPPSETMPAEPTMEQTAAAPAAVASAQAPDDVALYQKHLEQARSVKDWDVDSALEHYAQLTNAPDELIRVAMTDLAELEPFHSSNPRLYHVFEELEKSLQRRKGGASLLSEAQAAESTAEGGPLVDDTLAQPSSIAHTPDEATAVIELAPASFSAPTLDESSSASPASALPSVESAESAFVSPLAAETPSMESAATPNLESAFVEPTVVESFLSETSLGETIIPAPVAEPVADFTEPLAAAPSISSEPPITEAFAAPAVSEAITPAEPITIGIATIQPTPPSPHEAREATVYLDDSSAPQSVETQATPLGAAELQARLDLARTLKDIDFPSALEQYALLGDATYEVVKAAMIDLAQMEEQHQDNPRLYEVFEQLDARITALKEQLPSTEAPSTITPATPLAEAPPVEAPLSETLPATTPPSAETPAAAAPLPTPTVTTEPARAPREATAYFDDSSAPQSVEAQATPTGEAEHQARLDLARVMKDMDLSSALDLYALLTEAGEAVRQQAIADLAPFATADARVPSLLAALQAGPTKPAASTKTTGALPDWLAAVSTPEAEQVPPIAAPSPTRSPEEPQWLEAVPVSQTEKGAQTHEAVAYDTTGLPEWLAGMKPVEAAPPPESSAVATPEIAELEAHAKLPDWLAKPTTGALDKKKPESQPPVEEQPPQPLEPKPVEPPKPAPIPSWLSSLQTEVKEPSKTKPALLPRQTGALPRGEPKKTTDRLKFPRVQREGAAYLDDRLAPPSVEAQPLPLGDAEYQARLDLARALKFIDVNGALDLYELMVGAKASQVQQAIDDVTKLSQTNTRAQEILNKLQSNLSQSPTTTESTTHAKPLTGRLGARTTVPTPPSTTTPPRPSPSATDSTSKPPTGPLSTRRTSPLASPSTTTKPPTSPLSPRRVTASLRKPSTGNLPSRSSTSARPVTAKPSLTPASQPTKTERPPTRPLRIPPRTTPLWSARAPETPSTPPPAAKEPTSPTQPAASQPSSFLRRGLQKITTLKPTAKPAPPPPAAPPPPPPAIPPPPPAAPREAHTPREAMAYFDDAAAPVSVEKQALPTGEAERQAHLDLGRLLKDFDVNSALDQYEQVVGASEDLLAQARADLEPLVGKHPRVAVVLAKLGPHVIETKPAPLSEPEPPPAPVAPAVAPLETPTEHAPREATAYFDDSAAPASVETQALPTGEAEMRAHLDLARLLKDIDPDSALEQYAQLASASGELLQQARADLTVLAQTHPRAQALLAAWQSPSPITIPTPPPQPSQPVAAPTPTTPPATTATKLVESSLPPAAPERALREATAYFDDSSAPTSVEKQELPTGEAEHRAHLDLARLLKDFDLSSALDQYAQMVGASEDLLAQAHADLQPLVGAHPRVAEVLALLGKSAPAPTKTPAPPAQPTTPTASVETTKDVDTDGLPDWLKAAQPGAPTQAPAQPTIESGVVVPAWLASLQAQTIKPSPKAPPEAKAPPTPQPEALQKPTTPTVTPPPAPETKIAPLPIAPSPPPLPVTEPSRAPREAIAYFDDSSAPMSVEKQEAPTGEAEHQARLELARVMKEMDIDSALDLYAALTDASAAVKQQAYADLLPLAESHPRVVDILATLQVSDVEAQPPDVVPTTTMPEPAEPPITLEAPELPDWLKQLQPSAVTESAPPTIPVEEVAEPPPIEAAELPEWLQAMQPSAPEEPSSAPSELHIAEPGVSVEAELVAETTPAPAAMPAWLAALQTKPSTETHETKPTITETKPTSVEAELKKIEPAAKPETKAAPPPEKLAEPARAPREATAYFDDSSAPVSVEKQAAPTGEAEHLARLNLARALKDFDLNAAFELYDSLVDASDEVKRQAIEDLKPYATIELRAAAAVSHLREHLAAQAAAASVVESPTQPSSEATPTLETPVTPSESMAEAPIAETELPDWLRAMQPTAEATPTLETPVTPTEPDAEGMIEEGELPEWLRTMQPPVEIPGAQVMAEKQPEPPASQPAATQLGAPAPAPKPAEAAAGLPAWLAELQTSVQTSKPAPPPPPPPAPPPPVASPPPAHMPREATAYFDDSSAPVSVEKQQAPTGEAEHQARLDLARVMKEMDLDSALDLYALLTDAGEAVKAQAYADLLPLADSHPRVPELLALLRVSHEAAAEPVERVEALETTELPAWLKTMQPTTEGAAPIEVEAPHEAEPIAAAELPAWLKTIQPTTGAAAPSVTEVISDTEAIAAQTASTSIAETPLVGAPVVAPAELAPRVVREATAYFDDSSAPVSVEKQVAPTGEAAHQARLDLARMLREVDETEATNQYRSLIEGSVLLPQVIDDLTPLASTQPKVPPLRALLVEALIRAGRALEAIPYLR